MHRQLTFVGTTMNITAEARCTCFRLPDQARRAIARG
jgi:hypothetical protein